MLKNRPIWSPCRDDDYEYWENSLCVLFASEKGIFNIQLFAQGSFPERCMPQLFPYTPEQGFQIFLGTLYQVGKNILNENKWSQEYQMAVQ
jgi:hypothetical protein